jgi:hypothetical protein
MNAVHRAILAFLREVNDPQLAPLVTLTDEQIVHRMFSNQRGVRGVRLTKFGLQIMQAYFQTYDVKVPEDEVIKPTHLMFLDDHATLPYYCGDKRIIVFDGELGVKLRLVGGRLSVLVSIESS